MEANNMKAMRDALEKIYHEIRSYCFDYGAGESHRSLVDRILDDPPDYTSYRDSILEIDRIVEVALAAPPRNCDVGTAEEQEERYLKLKREHVDRLTRCPAVGTSFFFPDSLYWAQMPYEEGEVK